MKLVISVIVLPDLKGPGERFPPIVNDAGTI